MTATKRRSQRLQGNEHVFHTETIRLSQRRMTATGTQSSRKERRDFIRKLRVCRRTIALTAMELSVPVILRCWCTGEVFHTVVEGKDGSRQTPIYSRVTFSPYPSYPLVLTLMDRQPTWEDFLDIRFNHHMRLKETSPTSSTAPYSAITSPPAGSYLCQSGPNPTIVPRILDSFRSLLEEKGILDQPLPRSTCHIP